MSLLVAALLMAGTWDGSARPVNDFLARIPILVALTIGTDGTVEGRLGTAKMVKARLRPRAWYEWKAMNHYEYRIDFRLEGEFAPGVARKGGRVLLNWRGDHSEGWVVTEGSIFGGKDRVQVQARDLVLRRRYGP